MSDLGDGPNPVEDGTDTAQSAEARLEAVRMVEAILFASDRPLGEAEIQQRLPSAADVPAIIDHLGKSYEGRGVELVSLSGGWMFRTAADLAFLLRREVEEERKLSRAAVETLSIIAYKQPVTRAEIEDIRGVSISKGTLDVLLEAGWIKLRGRRKTPGRPVTYGTTDVFLTHFGLEGVEDLPGLGELKAAGLLDTVDEAFDRLGMQGEDDAEEDAQIDLEEAIEDDERAAGRDLLAADEQQSDTGSEPTTP